MSLTPFPSSSGNSLSLDTRSLDKLKYASGTDQKSAIKDTAKQLESLFMQELMKSMRSTTMNSGMLENSGTEMGTNMLDSQRAQQMSGLPGGLSDMIIKQLQRQLGGTDASADTSTSPFKGLGDLSMNKLTMPASPSATAATAAIAPASAAGSASAASTRKLSNSEQFVREHQAAAKAAEAATGIPANHILGQAALESGWGKHQPKMADGTTSHNLFGIKANSSWTGKVAEVTTTEYIGGVARKVTAKFRAYDSYEDAFKDHAQLLSKSPRYSQTVAQADTAQGFAKGLQKAGYATDPAYADKLTKVINTTLRLQRSVT
ncbi:flagellar assembly peptidoglycan hydrolase FlgJ [Aquabacterium sp. CECT 9606]|uniref:flagellar assembly peptidoglycan hydrolase FlgJ n=1 Tax=Aquabacterium sp. CECT 9606 TaxID=2845822 RepID=UPI001E65CFE4|nr:flagellar assembly peptidoglycan hydrolase FlgJ [Aquabacterium sp. CECT 9606]CAH0349208.1 Peptidoglycan hydrolase FlgJ [Aquabacterium sp. CECT 9606]